MAATTTTAEKEHTGTISLPPSSSPTDKFVYKKPVRLAPDRMGVVLYEPFTKALHIDDNITWFQQILTDQGLLLKPIHGMPSLHDQDDDGKGSEC